MYSSMLQTTIALLMVTLNGFMASPLAERGLSTWPDRILAPYLYTSKWNTFDIDNAFQKTGHSTWTLCFLIADKWGNPSWNADSTLDDGFYFEYIKKIRALGGDVIVSFGGAAGMLELT
jgi:chitinase